MKRTTLTAIALAMVTGPAMADPDADALVVNGEIEMVTEASAPAHLEGALKTVYSGWRFRSDETQAVQMDDFDNPGMLGVEVALDAWTEVAGTEGESCASCHGSPEEMAGVSATYPKWDAAAGEVQTLTMQMNECRTERMGAEPYAYDKGDAINMTALLTSVSRGMPMSVAIDGPAAETWEMGKELYYTRFGQLELSCANCHEDNYGMMIRADHLSQGQINGFPTYRLKNTKLNGVHSRFKGCIRDTRAETFAPGSPELIALELYVASRSNGLSVEGPSVRN
ncbi:SoxAX cytochrome complex subunit A [Jannaschia pagri]|uniref:SoxAX cytochrome complex subunit A n=1 Tax=Jannaschia pagri TaxID=2829797 RepID=A0ABQ4NQZ2_9RHOB|nr:MULTISPECIES: sulfur oxidation c-type cytochrome SoxA [unclassified Jannaschia]GIT92994.1 SoxAX cytochrome complex subunit A [Jannaschia sp. AI_61]GIT96829.1 SoxAX cytochrome complex subunit A [Jannaschia sp. AI_62]